MPLLVPDKPRLSSTELQTLLAPFAIDRGRYPLVVVGLRGYFKEIGVAGANDRGLYDDAVFIDSPRVTAAFNANTDPTGFRAGAGTGEGKGLATLNSGAWFVHMFADHHGATSPGYPALCQRAGDVTVTRDGTPPYQDTGRFGINIHRGSYNSTSSEGCQTIHPSQWDSFIATAQAQAQLYFPDSWKERVVPYVLFDA